MLLILVFSIANSFAQSFVVSGKVQDSLQKPVVSATVAVKNKSGGIVSFGFSNAQGNFSFAIADSLRSEILFLEVNTLGYAKESMKVDANQKNYLFTLHTVVNELEKVTVSTTQRIKSKGDTLTYDVKSFSAPEDRSIGDVIKRFPGMTVGEDGSITYNGKRVNNLLIHKDDLMDGRYGLATNTITKEMIRKVEVIQHYQPIAALKDKVFSDNVVVNLVLDDPNAVKISGQVQIGLGVPGLVNVFVNSILLNAKIKLLNSIKYNNSGEDYKLDLRDLRPSDNVRRKDLLVDAVVDNPSVPNKYYYDNNSFFTSLNNLFNTKDSLQIRLNVRYFSDRNNLRYNARTENYVVNDTIVYTEIQNLRRAPHNFSVSVNLLQNKTNYYFKNQFQANVEGYENNANLGFNTLYFSQSLSLRFRDFSNALQWIPNFVKRDVVSFNWSVEYFSAPQYLAAGIGLDSALLNNNIAYNSFKQFSEVPTFSNKFSINYYVNNGKALKQSYQIGVENQWQQLNSTLYLTQKNGTVTPYTGDYGNSLSWKQNRYFANATYLVKKEYWSLNLSMPFSLQQVKYNQDEYSLNANRYFFFLNPEIKSEYYFDGEHSVAASYRKNKAFGSIEDVYKGIIVTNYRLVTSNEAFVREIGSDEMSLGYRAGNTLKLLFFNAGVQYRNSLLNSVLSTSITNNIQRTTFVPLENRQSYFSVSGSVSKYFFAVRSKIGVNLLYAKQQSSQYVNQQLLPFEISNWTLGFSTNSKLFEFVSLDYMGTANFLNSRQTNGGANAISNNVVLYNQNASFIFTPAKIPFFLTVQGRHQFSGSTQLSQKGYFFLDLNSRYRHQKWHTDFEVSVNNLFDVRSFGSYYVNNNELVSTQYALRGRMLLLKATFLF